MNYQEALDSISNIALGIVYESLDGKTKIIDDIEMCKELDIKGGKIRNLTLSDMDNCKPMIDTLQELINNYHTLKNELCLLCGKYKNEHLGVCKDCRWHDGK